MAGAGVDKMEVDKNSVSTSAVIMMLRINTAVNKAELYNA